MKRFKRKLDRKGFQSFELGRIYGLPFSVTIPLGLTPAELLRLKAYLTAYPKNRTKQTPQMKNLLRRCKTASLSYSRWRFRQERQARLSEAA